MFFRLPQIPLLFLTNFILFLTAFTFITQGTESRQQLQQQSSVINDLKKELESTNTEYDQLKSQDQIKINSELKNNIQQINTTYKSALNSYEDLLDLKLQIKDTTSLDRLFSSTLSQLSEGNYASASNTLKLLDQGISQSKEKIAIALSAPPPNSQLIPESTTPPSSGYSRQSVKTDSGTFVVSLVAASLSDTKIIIDTASEGDCADNCPVLSLSDYVKRNNAFAGINGSYFCPETYPSCAGKKNSFDLLLMNKNKIYFNSSNNVYSNNPGVIFGNDYIRFVVSVSEWGRDTSINGMISNFPLLIMNGAVRFTGDSDAKKTNIGNRSFVANKGNTIFIGVVHSVSVAQSALVLKAMNMDNALNLDSGGSTALWSGGYKVGPGRNLPNVILFVRK